jgi:putative tricarboxylic transport membrane protein
MKKIDIFSSLFLILLGGVFCFYSLRLGIGKINAPGPGLIPFGTGAFLILLSLGTILEAHYGSKAKNETRLFRGKRVGIVIGVQLSLFAYVFLLNTLGFIIATFLLMTILFRISEKPSWPKVLFSSAITTGFSFFLFDYVLECGFPRGILGF